MAMNQEKSRMNKGGATRASNRLKKDFFGAGTLSLAQSLLGKLLVRELDGQRISGIIVETEAYLATDDTASHSFRGQSKRNAAMFMQAGTLYIYTIHAKHCLNIVTGPAGVGTAVLVRALQPWEGLSLMRERRARESLRDLCAGPARLCQALAIDLALDKLNLIESNKVWLEEGPAPVLSQPWRITSSSRIGISSAQSLLYRYFIDGHHCVSGLARLHQQRRSWLFGPAPAGH